MIALAMICKGSDDEARLLDRCLKNMSPHVDAIFVTRTHLPGEKLNAAVARVAKRYKAQLSDFEWIYDFSAARNFNFAQVPKEYGWIIWSDADDIWRGLDKLSTTIEANPSIDAYGVEYLYDWDEFRKPTVVHRKTMLIRNDGCAEWEGAIHEDLSPTRRLDIMFLKGVDRLHLSNTERHAGNAVRNLDIAKRQQKENPDDPRSYWNLANSSYGVSDYEAARTAYDKFLETSESDEEKYLAHQRLGDLFKTIGDTDNAVRELRIAIGLQPELPEAYFQLAHVLYEAGDYDKAEHYLIQGLPRKPRLEKMIVYNPRDYDFNPMMLLAKVYYQKNRPDLMLPMLEGCSKIYPDDEKLKQMVKDGRAAKKVLGKALETVSRLEKITDLVKLKKELDALPLEMKSHPGICSLRNRHFTKTEASGKDLVIYCGNTVHQWNPDLFKTKGFGGSEEAVVHLAREWAQVGWNVTVYNNCGHKAVEEVEDGSDYWETTGRVSAASYEARVKISNGTAPKVTYRPFWEFNYRDRQDVVILWRWPKPLDHPINAPKVFVDMHDVIPAGEFTTKRIDRVTKIFVKTQFHRSLFPNVPDSKIVVIPNGMVAPAYTEKDPNLIINTSSPDRSLDVLPAIFTEIKKKAPNARMAWAYGWDNYKNTYSNETKKMQWMTQTIRAMKEAGIEDLGRLTQAEVGQLYSKAKVFAYPTEFPEIDCISVKKAQAAGCIAVTTDFAALEESNMLGVKVHSEKTKDNWNKPYQFHFGFEGNQKPFVAAVVKALKSKNPPEPKCQEIAARFSWPRIAKEWHNVFNA